jgi:hypothetical protein
LTCHHVDLRARGAFDVRDLIANINGLGLGGGLGAASSKLGLG